MKIPDKGWVSPVCGSSLPPTMLIPRPCEAETRRISKTFSGPQCFDGDEALISSKDPDLGDKDGDFVMDNVWGAFVPLGERREDLGAGSGGVTAFLDTACTELSMLSVEEEVVVTEATLSFSKLLVNLPLLASSGDISCSGETNGA